MGLSHGPLPIPPPICTGSLVWMERGQLALDLLAESRLLGASALQVDCSPRYCVTLGIPSLTRGDLCAAGSVG